MLPKITNCSWADLATVSSLKYRAARSLEAPDGRLFHSVAAVQCALSCIELMGEISEPNVDLLEVLSTSNQIDPGEAILLALTAADPNGYFLTGDKRALKAVSQLDIAPSFAGRMIIVEQILWKCLQVKGHGWLLENVCPFKSIDKTISIILGSRCDADAMHVCQGFSSYVSQVVQLHNPSLLVEYGPYEL
ncbi:hypothetical protein [uncultured Desulfuromusa sp.]|uniref:hypothetical protein n=1 Tax=uncultured Desulfuromusa sp. TaxID=219183 RepID=UPI0037482A32